MVESAFLYLEVENLSGGQYMALWDLLDQKGRKVPAGIYILRAKTDGVSRSVKLGLLN